MNDASPNRPDSGGSSLSEADFLARQSNIARSAMRETCAKSVDEAKRAADPRIWARNYPWASLGVAAAIGGAAATLVVPRTKPPARKATDTLAKLNTSARRQAAMLAVVAGTKKRKPVKRAPRRPGVTARLMRAGMSAAISSASGGVMAAVSAPPKPRSTVPAPAAVRQTAPGSTATVSAKRKKHAPAKSWWSLIKQTFSDWSEDKAPRLGAALSYYTVFSIAPLLIITVAIVGMVWGDEAAAEGALHSQLVGFLGAEGAEGVEGIIAAARKPQQGIIATVVGVVALLFGASGVFGQLKDALNTIWEVEPKPGRGIWGIIRDRFLSFAMVLVIGFLLLVSLVLSAVMQAAQSIMADLIPGPDIVMHIADIGVSFLVITLLFAMMFKFLPDVQIGWRDVWIGAAATALLFVIGKYLIGLYMTYGAVGSAYGAVGSLVIVLVWVYYSAQILFLGAEFTQVYAQMYGSRIVPSPMAQPVTAEARAQQGLSPGKP